MFRKLTAGVAALVVTAGLITVNLTTLGCDGDDGGPPTLVTVVVTPETQTTQAGATAQFTAEAFDSDGNLMTGVTFSWTSSEPSVASVDANGLATAAVAGVTEIQATADGVSDFGTLTVVPNSSPDPPDDNFVDTNGDGIDGEIARAVFVATSGSDANPGTITQPKATIGAGIAAAVADPAKNQVYISSGLYVETVQLADGIHLYGGYNAAAAWARSFSNTATIQGDTTAVIGRNITQIAQVVFVDLLTIESADNMVAGGNSTGIYLENSDLVVLRNLTINAGSGGPGAPGQVGNPGAPGLDGQAGTIPVGGLGGDTVTGVTPSGKGGDGGNGATTFPADGGTGGDGLPQPGGGLGGLGGPDPAPGDPDACPIDGFPGDPGMPGSFGLDGTPGPGGDGNGNVVGGYWAGSPGSAGTPGAPGFGGGAGGGGSAGRLLTGAMVCLPVFGGGGGGGGSGGQGGDPGDPGDGGGGSFGVFAYNSAVQIDASTITAGDGGSGGQGASGGAGGPGGIGGMGSVGDSNQGMPPFGGPGGDGSDGGAGGIGGPGGGGGGGVSFAVYRAGTSPNPDIDVNTVLTAGMGGAGGTAPGGNAGDPGASGEIRL